MSEISVELSALHKAINECHSIQDCLKSESLKMLQQYESLSVGWNDDKYRELGRIVHTCNDALHKPLSELQRCEKFLQQLNAAMVEYEEIHFNSNSISHNNNTSSDNNIVHINCRNSNLSGSTHPLTGVPFEHRQIHFNNQTFDVVSPVFESAFSCVLPDNMLQMSDREQFTFCSIQLETAIARNPALEAQFSTEQLEQIMNGEAPDGYVWHHDSYVGHMQLVDSRTHHLTGHTGGRSIWGGGSDNR